LEAAFLKGTIDETELLLKESVDREMTLEDKLKDQTSQLEKLETELHSLEERQRKRYADVMKEKEDC
jgi:septal ring factor EnvC (AmiA/AmiB activator)